MQAYIINLKERFGTAANLARFMGVSVHTVWSWTSGRNTPRDVELRMLEVLGLLVLEAPHVFDALIGKEAPRRCAPFVLLPPLQPLPVKQAAQPVKRGPFDFEPSKILTQSELDALYPDDRT